jgi:CDP-4-dehydro-6-deoxyglucose reductase, E1
MIPLVKDTIDKKDIDELIEWLKTYPHLTKGELTVEFEKRWSSMLGCQYSVFVNSGSSANLLMLYTLIESGILKTGDKVIVPAVSWSTDLAPVIQLGLEAVLCDCNMQDLSVDLDHLRQIIKKENPKALLLVSVLGMVPQMETIVDICERNNVVLLEDACESLGSEHNYKKIGNFGAMSSFSSYFGHHISTIEGGMVCTNDKTIYNILKSIRSHGWDRDLDPDVRDELRKKHNVSDFESLYKFYHCGFNVRSTDLQAFLGLGQLKKLDSIIKARNKNYNLYCSLIKNDFWSAPQSTSRNYVSNFAFPVIHPDRERIVSNLNKNDIAVRPLICGSLEKQPMWRKRYPQSSLQNADTVDCCGLYLPNNHQITEEEIKTICEIVNESIK